MRTSSLLIPVFATLCLGQPTWWKRLLINTPIQVNVSAPDTTPTDNTTPSSSMFAPTSSPASTSPAASSPTAVIIETPPQGPPQIILTPNPNTYEVFATGRGNCKQGFIGNINAPACWSSVCGPWNSLKIRQIYNATLTVYSSNACTGPAERVNPICAPGDLQQDCGFSVAAGQRYMSFRVVPGCAQTTASEVCNGGLQSMDCASGSCLGSLIT